MNNNSNKKSDSRRRSSSSDEQLPSHKTQIAKKLEGRESEVIPLQIERATQRYLKSRTSDPEFSQNLRWVRNNQQNRGVLMDFIILRVIVTKVLKGHNWSYLPCCNVISRYKPTGKGHKNIKWNPLLFLLDEEERSKVLTFKKKLVLKSRSVPKKDKFTVLMPQLFNYLKANIELKQVKELVEGLPKKDRCFHLPLFRCAYTEDCPGPCPLAESEETLDFKVDLFSLELDQINDAELSKSQNSSKNQKSFKEQSARISKG